MTTKEHAELLDLVIGRAVKLREAGVLELDVSPGGGLHVKLAPAAPAESQPQVEAESDEPDSDPWNDPTSYGRAKGVPGKDPRRKEP